MIRDDRPSALDWRVYACASLHDGMSLRLGKGRGCYASRVTLAAEVGCDYSNLCKSLKRLVEWGYLTHEQQKGDRRLSTYRVVFDAPEVGSFDPPSQEAKMGEATQIVSKKVGQPTQKIQKQLGQHTYLNHEKDRESFSHYIPLKGELDAVETGEKDSVETARFAPVNDFPDDGFPNHSGSPSRTVEGAWQGHPDPSSANIGGQLSWLERHLRECPDSLDGETLQRWVRFLEEIAERQFDDLTSHWARRLLDDIGDTDEFVEMASSADVEPASVPDEFCDVFSQLFGPNRADTGRAILVAQNQPEPAGEVVQSVDGLPSGQVIDGLSRMELGATERALRAELDEFERSFGRASKDLDIDAWLPRLEAVAVNDDAPDSLRSRARRLITDANHRLTCIDAAARAAERRAPVPDEEVNAATRERLLAVMNSEGWADIVTTVTRRTKMTPQALIDFSKGAPISSRQRGNLILTLNMISTGNGAG